MTICYILKWFPRLSQTFVLDELLELQRQGADLVIVALKAPAAPEPLQAQYRELRAPVHYLAEFGQDLPSAPTDVQAAALAPWLREQGVEHVHAHFATWAAGLAVTVGKLTGIPVSFTAHARDIFHARVEPRVLAGRIAQAQFVVTVSDYNKRYLDGLLRAEGKAGNVIRLYNGVDVRHLEADAAPKQPDLVVGVGRLVAKKGFDYLVDACRLLRERGRRVRCVIVGEGEEREALAQQVARAGLEQDVVLVGALPRAEVARLIRQAAVVALPCVVDPEGDRDGLPTVLLEAMALGTPVISTRVAGIPEMIDDGHSGLLVDERDAPALADAIAAVLDSPALQARLRAAAVERVQRDFSLTGNVRRLRASFLGDRLTA